jgi:hypothetical protein
VAFAKDQWTKAVKQADGSVKRERERSGGDGARGGWGSGLIRTGRRSKVFETKVRPAGGREQPAVRDRGLADGHHQRLRTLHGSERVPGAQRVPGARGRRRAHQAQPGQSRIVKKPARRLSKVVAWADETVDSIVEVHPERFTLIPIIGSAAGLRQGEMFGLSVDGIDFEEQVIRVRRQVKRLGKEYVFALTEQSRSKDDLAAAYGELDESPGLL